MRTAPALPTLLKLVALLVKRHKTEVALLTGAVAVIVAILTASFISLRHQKNEAVKQKVVANLGRRDTLEAVLPLLNRFFAGDDDEQQLAKQLGPEAPIEAVDASTWGPMLVTRHFFGQLGLWEVLDAGRRWPK